MKHNFVPLAAIVLTLGSTAQAADEVSYEAIVNAYVEAFNARDLEAMSSMLHEDAAWYSVVATTTIPMGLGRADILSQLEAYFASTDTISENGSMLIEGNRISVVETARWTGSDGEPRSQSALAVYEIDHGLILTVWYYPAQ